MAVDIRNEPPPPEWGVTVAPEAIERLAQQWAHRSFPLPKWDYDGLPNGLDDANWYNFCVVSCSVLACLWPPEGDAMWTTHYGGKDLDDAPALFSCFNRRIEDGRFDLGIFEKLTARDFFAGEGTLQLLDERWNRVGAVVAAILDRWSGQIQELVTAADHDAEEVVESLVATIPGFNDTPVSPVGALPFQKLARLATAMMAAGGSQPFARLDRLPVYADYMLPRVLRHHGVIKYEPALSDAVDSRRLVPKESSWELGIRWATVYCGDQLVAALRRNGCDVSTPALDYALWESAVLGPHAGEMGEHHRTITLAY
jgi:hypothetical protein